MSVLSIKLPIRKKSGNLFNDPLTHTHTHTYIYIYIYIYYLAGYPTLIESDPKALFYYRLNKGDGQSATPNNHG